MENNVKDVRVVLPAWKTRPPEFIASKDFLKGLKQKIARQRHYRWAHKSLKLPNYKKPKTKSLKRKQYYFEIANVMKLRKKVEDRELTGFNIEYYENEKTLKSFSTTKGGKIHGHAFEFFPCGSLKKLSKYVHGDIVGTVYEYQQPNLLHKTYRYSATRTGNLSGVYQEYSQYGKPLKILRYEGNRPSGTVYYFYKTGMIRQEERFDAQGKLHGRQCKYWANGIPKEIQHWVHGKRKPNSRFVIYDRYGNVVDEKLYNELGNVYDSTKLRKARKKIKRDTETRKRRKKKKQIRAREVQKALTERKRITREKNKRAKLAQANARKRDLERRKKARKLWAEYKAAEKKRRDELRKSVLF